MIVTDILPRRYTLILLLIAPARYARKVGEQALMLRDSYAIVGRRRSEERYADGKA